MTGVVWSPSLEARDRSRTRRFMVAHGITRYDDLVRRSIEQPEWFWHAVVNYLGLPFHRPYTRVIDDSRGAAWTTWFSDGGLNLSQVCVDRWAATAPDRVAVAAENESGACNELTFRDLAGEVGRAAGALSELGVARGDTVVLFMPMGIETVIAFLAVARIGAIAVPIFSGFGAAAVATRVLDAGARVLVTADAFLRRGRRIAMKETADEAIEAVGGVLAVLVVRHAGGTEPPMKAGRDRYWHEALAAALPTSAFEATMAEDPVLLAYTSGTTGKPKGIVHVHAGLTVKLAQEAAFQTDVGVDDVVLWITDMGWIMGPWLLVGGLANGATIVVFDGAPDHPRATRVWDLVERHRVTVLGLSPTLVRALSSREDSLPAARDLASLRCFASTGEPWNVDPWWWLFDAVGRRQFPIVNLSGGTEVGACFLSVNLLQGLKPVALGGPALGMAVDVVDDDGQPVRERVGELVCTRPWPGMTRGIWQDPDRYLETYWSRWPGVWVHGDWASIDEDGFWYLHGRSDDTLNVGGKRIGPAEIESAAVGCAGVTAAAAVGVPDEKGEVLVIYYVGVGRDPEAMGPVIEAAVVEEFGKPFRPGAVVSVPDLPRTRSGKIVRRAVRARSAGTDPGDLSSLENPESLAAIEPIAAPTRSS